MQRPKRREDELVQLEDESERGHVVEQVGNDCGAHQVDATDVEERAHDAKPHKLQEDEAVLAAARHVGHLELVILARLDQRPAGANRQAADGEDEREDR